MSDDHKTLFAIRIGRDSPLHGLYVLAKILGAIVLGIAFLAALQIKLCKDDFPELSAMECLRGIGR